MALPKMKLPSFKLIIVFFWTLYISASVMLTKWLGLPALIPVPIWVGLLVGLPLLALGVFILRNSFTSLGTNRALGRELYLPKSESTLITGGIYAHVRNPLYLAVLILLLGWLFVLRLTLIVFLTAIFMIHFWLVVKWEERELLARFGDDYEEYRRRVPRFIPRRKR